MKRFDREISIDELRLIMLDNNLSKVEAIYNPAFDGAKEHMSDLMAKQIKDGAPYESLHEMGEYLAHLYDISFIGYGVKIGTRDDFIKSIEDK